MKLDLNTKELFTDEGNFLKVLECPKKVQASELKKLSADSYKCSFCDHIILETAGLTDEQLQQILKKDPQQCLKVNINQSNLKIRKYVSTILRYQPE